MRSMLSKPASLEANGGWGQSNCALLIPNLRCASRSEQRIKLGEGKQTERGCLDIPSAQKEATEYYERAFLLLL